MPTFRLNTVRFHVLFFSLATNENINAGCGECVAIQVQNKLQNALFLCL